MGRPELLRVAERGVAGVRGPNSGIRSGKKLMKRMETNSLDRFGLFWFLLGFSDALLGLVPFHPFSIGSPLWSLRLQVEGFLRLGLRTLSVGLPLLFPLRP